MQIQDGRKLCFNKDCAATAVALTVNEGFAN